MRLRRKSVLFTLAIAYAQFPSAAFASDKPVVSSVEGDGVVMLVSDSSDPRLVKEGEVLEFGGHLRTGPFASAKVRYPDGTVLVIGRSSDVEVDRTVKSAPQENQVNFGGIRAIVEKSKDGLAAKPKFIIRTRSATMGVRGTDFVVNVDGNSGASELRTLEGRVDVGRSVADVMSGNATPVTAGQFISIGSGPAPIPPSPTAFAPKAYIAEMRQTQPEMSAIPMREIAMNTSSPVELPPEAKSETKAAINEEPEKPLVRLHYADFRMGAAYVGRPSQGYVYTGKLSWNPAFYLFRFLAVRGNLAAYPLKEATGSGTFVASQAGLIGELTLFSTVSLEMQVGAEYWGGGNATALGSYNGPGLSVRVGDGLIERLFVGYTFITYPAPWGHGDTSQIDLGVGLRF